MRADMRIRQLLDLHRAKWFSQCDTIWNNLEGWNKLIDPAVFRRGFVHSINCTADNWLAHADAITASQPVQEVALTTMPELQCIHVGWHTTVWLDGMESNSINLSTRGDIANSGVDMKSVAIKALLHSSWPRITFILPTA